MKTETLAPEALFSPLRVWLRELPEISKARLTMLVLMTTWAGYYLGSGPLTPAAGLLHCMLGTALVAVGASAFNQFLERETDQRMKRTSNRPLPAGRLNADEVLLFACVTSILGMSWLALAVNLLAATLAALTLLVYVFVYTPLKRVSAFNTLVGAVPGALPPLIGWAAATGGASIEGWYLFVILFLWQMPHFLAIAWMYREDYAQAGIRMLSVEDETGLQTARQAVSYCAALLPCSLLPAVFHMVHMWYFPWALILGLAYLAFAVHFLANTGRRTARRLFLASIAYLPLLLLCLVWNKL